MNEAAESLSNAAGTGPLRILITNITMAHRTGTETYVRDLAISLLKRGHTPIVYTTDPGQVSNELRSAGVPVVDDLTSLAVTPDVIHGHHHPETVTALLRFPDTPAIFACHDRLAWHDSPPRFPRVLRYLAVDDNCRDRLLYEEGIPPERLQVIPNSVDLERFKLRSPLPQQPKRALAFSNYARTDDTLPLLQSACERAGIVLDVIGAGVGKPCAHPEEVIPNYDVVFAKARCALEALACGASVILWHDHLLGPLVTSQDLERLRRLNLGRRTLTRPLHAAAVDEALRAYDAVDAAEVTRRVREEAGLEKMTDQLVDLYRDVISEGRTAGSHPAEDLVSAANYLRHLAPFRLNHELESRQAERNAAVHESQAIAARWRAEYEALQRSAQNLQQREIAIAQQESNLQQRESAVQQRHAQQLQWQSACLDLQQQAEQSQQEMARLRGQVAQLAEQLAAVHNSRTIRLRNRLLHIPFLQRLIHLAIRPRCA